MQTELHRHLDVSIRLSTLLRLAQERGLESQSTSLEAFHAKHVLKNPMSSLSQVLVHFVPAGFGSTGSHPAGGV
jgi:adenosine deaminase